MENLNLECIILALLGVIIHIAMKVVNRTNQTEKFSLKVWCADKLNIVRVLLAVASTIAILIMGARYS